VLATGPLTSDALAASLAALTGQEHLAFFDAAAPIVMADSLDDAKLFRQSRYEGEGQGDYLNAPMDKGQYQAFIDALVGAERVMAHDFESRDLFQACQPIEEIARKGPDAPRFGTLKPVGLTDPRTGRRPWAALQLRAEDAHGTSYNLVGFQTNLTFPEQRRVFRMIPGLEQAEFARYGVMHRNTFIEAPKLLAPDGRLRAPAAEALGVPVYVAGQLAGTEGYGEAIRSGLHVALAVAARLRGVELPPLPPETAFGALMAYATDPATTGYQPMHVNFGIVPPLAEPVRNKGARYAAYAERGAAALAGYAEALRGAGLLGEGMAGAAAAGFAGEAAEPGAGGEAPAEAAPAEGARR
jgi:methylenetetrahydrofolate--tRNA-(uracil-5-)-methyltransferase